LQLLQLGCEFRRDKVRDGGQQLRHLHDRTLQPAQRLCNRRGIRGIPSGCAAEQALPRHPGRHPADIGADPGIASGTGGKSVGFRIAFGHGHSGIHAKADHG
jgi:hypothetical protein